MGCSPSKEDGEVIKPVRTKINVKEASASVTPKKN